MGRAARPLMLGEAPGPSGGTSDPLGARTARRLCVVAGWEPELFEFDPYRAALARRFELRNLLDRNPGKAGKGMAFPREEARSKAAELEIEGRVLVVLGRRVWTSLGARRAAYFEWAEVRGAKAVCIPHPSGIVRSWNDPAVREAAGRILREAADCCAAD